ncbi:hypothetical protein D3C85_1504090 [compost metagenome]
MLFGAIGFTLTDGQGFRHQQRLTAQAFAGHGDFQALVHDPLVSGMHVHQHQPLGVFRKNVDAFKLRQRVTQRRNIILAGRESDRIGFGQRCEKLAIGCLRLGCRDGRLRARGVLILITRASA